ncbi:hypothetical protein AB0C76_33130 [Kitasatospora sp. NPDC048722]|uniref:hypothetical protein n=1 Tax=Kitasatospora sp. NPDC048722 TaxID=3155639 RepID=UPI0034071577
MTPDDNNPYGEEIEVSPEHIATVLRTVDRSDLLSTGMDAHVRAAVVELAASVVTRPPGAEVCRVQAWAACVVALHADAAELLDLDEGDRDTYVHPAIVAEEELRRALAEQAPRTLAAFEVAAEAQHIVTYAGWGGEVAEGGGFLQ